MSSPKDADTACARAKIDSQIEGGHAAVDAVGSDRVRALQDVAEDAETSFRFRD